MYLESTTKPKLTGYSQPVIGAVCTVIVIARHLVLRVQQDLTTLSIVEQTEMRNTTSHRYHATRQELIQAAYAIIRAQGVDGLSMRKLAQAVNQSPANLYEYFSGKEEIVLFVFAQTSAVLKAHLVRVDSSLPAQEYLLALCFAYLEFAQRETGHMLVLQDTAQATFRLRETLNTNAGTTPPTTPPTTAPIIESLPLFLAGVERYLQTTAQPPVVTVEVQEITHALLALVTGLAAETIHQVTPLSQSAMRTAIQQFLSGLATGANR